MEEEGQCGGRDSRWNKYNKKKQYHLEYLVFSNRFCIWQQ